MKKFLCCLIIIITCFTITNVNASNTFYDTRGTKYEGVVERMAKLGIVNGMNETTYAPYKGVTRAELAKMITIMKGIEDFASSVEYRKTFSDVKESDWFYPYVMIASDLELINGYEDGTFKPNQEVTYAELVAILLRNLGYINIKEDSANGWYWNYIVRMREIELNDNVGEFDYTKSANRGDVAMFVWNALITDRWAISMENEFDGFTYTYAEKTPLEIFFEEYNFIDNETVNYIGGKEEKIIIGVNNNYFYTNEKTPLYVLGGKITALYNAETKELIGVTFDEDYENIEVVSGPKFYLEEEGYRPARALKTSYYGTKSEANYVYLVINKETEQILRSVYLDASNSIIVDSISVKNTNESGDTTTLKEITINEQQYSSREFALIEDGFALPINRIKKDDVLTYLGNGLYAYSNEKITDTLTGFKYDDDKLIIAEDEYIVFDDCIYNLYKNEDSLEYNTLSSKKLKEYIDTEITVTLNIAEEICIINFGKIDENNEKYKIGFVTDVYFGEDTQSIRVNYGEDKTSRISIKVSGNNYVTIGDLVSLDENNKYTIITKDQAFDNDISVKYQYDAKKISYPMIGEYMVNEDTNYYKVTLEYEDNSVTKIKSCEISKLDLNEDIDELSAYTLTLIYNEDMEIVKVYAVNEINKFENQIALIKNFDYIRKNGKIESAKVTLSVIGDAVRGYEVTSNEEKFIPGDVITFTYKENGDSRTATLEEVFKKEFIGYKRDLVVKEFDRNNKVVTFENGTSMDLTKDVYNWQGTKINLNRYRFVIADVSNREGYWKFISLDMDKKEKLVIEENDRFAIGELQDVIVIYRGYEE